MRAGSMWLFALFVLALMPAHASNAAEIPRELRFELRAMPSYTSGEAVTVTFVLTGHPTQALQVLRWNTPLEGLRGRIFRITRDGVEIPYNGRMYKRGEPAREDYVLLAAGAELRGDVDLATAYDFTRPGEYHVTFTGEILDAAPANTPVPRKGAQFSRAELRGEPIVITLKPKP